MAASKFNLYIKGHIVRPEITFLITLDFIEAYREVSVVIFIMFALNILYILKKIRGQWSR